MPINHNQIYADLLKFQTDCHLNDLNVTIPDPRKIQSKLIDNCDYQRRVSIYSNQIRPEITMRRNQLEIEKLNLRSKSRDILTNNQKVKDIPSQKERELATEGLLDAESRQILQLQNEINNYEDLAASIETTAKILKTAEQDIKLLIRVMETQTKNLNVGTIEDPEVKGLTNNLSDLDKMANLSDEIGLEDDVESSEEFLQTEQVVMTTSFGSNDSTPQVDNQSRGDNEQTVEDSNPESQETIDDVLSDLNGGVPKSTQSDAAVPVEDSDLDLTELFSGEDSLESSDENEEGIEERPLEVKTVDSPVKKVVEPEETTSLDVDLDDIGTEGTLKETVVEDLDIDLSSFVSNNTTKPKEEKASIKSVEKPVVPLKQQTKTAVIEDEASVSSVELDIEALLSQG